MLELQNIHWQLPDGGEILKGISLSIPDGQLTVVTGPNGGGKTSLAKVIAGLYAPSEAKYFSTVRTSPNSASPTVPKGHRIRISAACPLQGSYGS